MDAASIRPYLLACGYRPALIRSDFTFGSGPTASLVAFAYPPADARSACVAVLDGCEDSRATVLACQPLGTPIVFVCGPDSLHWWSQDAAGPRPIQRVAAPDVPRFFQKRGAEFRPERVYRAKTWARFDKEFQLSFVDRGLMPLIEGQIGQALQDLIERNVAALKSNLRWKDIDSEQGHWLLQTVFGLVSAKILRDKAVPAFEGLELAHVDEVFTRLAQHYSVAPVPILDQRQRAALAETAQEIRRFSHLGLATTESLAYVYENALISKEIRAELGIHSTPPYLVDYIVGKLGRWIEGMAEDERQVFEPACGHAGFLVAAMRLLTELLPPDRAAPASRRNYLRKRVHGCEIDPFALEIARLSLTLADIPNPDGWDLVPGDMFLGDLLERQSRKATVLLANPPFEKFSRKELDAYREVGAAPRYLNKTAEMLGRTLPQLPAGAVFGIVGPESILHNRNSRDLREILLRDFEISEICCFPDKVFAFSDMESAVILGRRRTVDKERRPVTSFRRVREREMDRFKLDYHCTVRRDVAPSRFSAARNLDLRVPELEEVWDWCRQRRCSTLGTLADVGLGLIYLGRELPSDARTYSADRFPGAVRGFVHFDCEYLHQTPTAYWLNVSDDVLLRSRAGTTTGVPQVLLNYAPASRGPWRLKALIDREGRALTSRFIAVRAAAEGYPLEYFWAMMNSSVANAFAYCHLGKRDNIVSTIRDTPIPQADPEAVARIVLVAQTYLAAVSREGVPDQPVAPETARDLLLRVDAEVLRLYQLPPQLERELLDLFAGWPRVGVPFSFERYFPSHFEDCLPLHDLIAITQDWPKTNRRRDELIEKKVRRKIGPDEKAELNRLQELADLRVRLVAPLPLRQLEQVQDFEGEAR